jgi:hypothetical protein
MKVSALAVAVASTLGLDSAASLKVKNAIDLVLAADKKAKDEGGLGPVDNLKDKAKDEKDDPEGTNAEDAMEDIDAEDEDETESDKARGKDKKAKDKKAKDKFPEEAEDDVQPSKSVTGGGSPAGNAGKEPAKDAKAMDAKINAALAARDALHVARRAVEPVLGVVTYDSAADVYKAALTKLGVTVDGIDASAFPALYKMACERTEARAPSMASDAATVKGMAALLPGYDRLK